jgi:hypothetical protein
MFRVPKQVHAAMIDPTAKGIEGKCILFSRSAAETIGNGHHDVLNQQVLINAVAWGRFRGWLISVT